MTKLKRLILSEHIFPGFFKTGEIHVRCVDGLPENAEFVRLYQQDGRIEVVFSSEDWPQLADGDLIPLIQPLYDKL